MKKQPNVQAKSRIVLTLLLLMTLPGLKSFAVNEALINRPLDGNRAEAVHRIPLLDENHAKITAYGHPEPFSTRMTCGECHNYDKISHGWHFSAGLTTATQSGRPGEPWMLSDAITFTQLPVSLRGWKGTWQPSKIGMTPWDFAKAFGGYLPGGGVVDVDPDSSDTMTADSRWDQAGALEINCLACHAASHQEDMSEYASQIGNLNFKWAATAASGLAVVEGSVKALPTSYDLNLGRGNDGADGSAAPAVHYDKAAFDYNYNAFVPITGKPENSRCYACHSSVHQGSKNYMTDQDVHLAAGLNCVDCHRNGIDHMISRNDANDPAVKADPQAMSLTCKGCHLGEGGAKERFDAPRPQHKGLPPVHLEKMSCTACHSGAAPEAVAGTIKTSRANKLGSKIGGNAALPLIASPVIVNQGGKLVPCNITWPAFWGTMKGETVTPLLPEKVKEVAGAILIGRDDTNVTGTETILNDWKAARVLKALGQAFPGADPVYVSGGKVHTLGAEGKLSEATGKVADVAAPYAWPVAHDVRPAAQALGAKGCTECHSADSAFVFGTVQVGNMLSGETTQTIQMAKLEGLDANYQQMFASSFKFRPWFKIFGFAASGLLLGVLLSYGAAGLGGLCRILGRRN